MAILKEDLKFFKSSTYNDTINNGGLPSNIAVVNAVSENIFPTISQAERIAGSTKYRKLFLKPDADGSFPLYNSRVYIENPTLADEAVYIFAGTNSQAQGSITGSERVYGCGWLNSSIPSGASELTARIENASFHIYDVGDKIRISNKSSIDDTLNSEEVRTIDTISWIGNVATITLDSPLDNEYSATANATRIASLLELGDIKADYSSFTVNSGAGDYNDTTSPLVMHNKGTVDQTWVLTFSTSSSFNIVGNTLGNVGTGNVTSGASPTNPISSRPYFTLPSLGFSGSFQAGDTISFATVPAAKGVWFKRVVPANTPSFTGNKFVVVFDGEAD